jgi:hypothetical protein
LWDGRGNLAIELDRFAEASFTRQTPGELHRFSKSRHEYALLLLGGRHRRDPFANQRHAFVMH